MKWFCLVFCLMISHNSFAQEFSLMSWNVYFDDDSGRERYPRILETLFKQSADIICLQEVTPQFYQQLQKHKPQHYQLLNGTEKFQKYGNVMLVNLDRIEYQYQHILDLPTQLQRSAQVVALSIGQQNFEIANLHLESMRADQAIRVQQLEKIVSFFNKRPAILCGDMNFGDEEPDGKTLPISFRDSATSKLSTYDVIHNPLAIKTKEWFEPSRRLDRFYIQGPFAVHDYQVTVNTLSDHYPVIIRLKLVGK